MEKVKDALDLLLEEIEAELKDIVNSRENWLFMLKYYDGDEEKAQAHINGVNEGIETALHEVNKRLRGRGQEHAITGGSPEGVEKGRDKRRRGSNC